MAEGRRAEPGRAEGLLVALGGHALLSPGVPPSLAAQRSALHEALAPVARLASRREPLVLTHGNGPQVGHALERVAAARGRAYALPLDVCVAQTQAEIGYLIAQELEALLADLGAPRAVACVVTRAEVARDDPRLLVPVKPLGSDGLRRVPSPLPVRVLETEAVRALLATGTVVVAAGGGGIPVLRGASGRLEGVEAVIDKDATSTVLALALGLPRILSLMGADAVRLHYGTPEERVLRRLEVREARRWLAEGRFEAGSMAPKVEAAAAFVSGGGRSVDVTSPACALDALEGRAGTRIVEDA